MDAELVLHDIRFPDSAVEKPDLVTVGLSSLYPIGILTVWKAEFASVTPSTRVLAAPEHQTQAV